MTVIAEFAIPIAEFALHDTLERRPDMVFEIDRVVADDTTHVVPFVRATRGELDGLTGVLEADPSVEEVDHLAETEDERFYRMVWTDTAQVIGYMVAEQEATVQEATASGGEWHLRVFFPERSGLSATNEYAHEHGFDLNVETIYGVEDFEQARFDLTDRQYDTLVAAVERGYYEIPREIDTAGLADALGISHQALSERFRRATKSLITKTLFPEDETD